MFLPDPLVAQTRRPSESSGDPRSLARKPRDRRTALGQVFTPTGLADVMARRLDIGSLGEAVKILDPCVGPDTFPAAIRRCYSMAWNLDAVDVDDAMCAVASSVSDRRVNVERSDYLRRPLGTYDAAILNPPYVRQEWIEEKRQLGALLKTMTGASIPGTANLYVYFIVKALAELREGGRMACLVYDSWQSTLYGRWLRNHLDQQCDWTTEAVPDCPFEGRLIDATIIYATRKANSSEGSSTIVSSGSTPGHASIATLFESRRGLRLKQSDFFLTSASRRNEEGSTPFVKKVGRITGLTVSADHDEAALLVARHDGDPRTIETLERRLAAARTSTEKNVAILTWADERPDRWHLHGEAPTAPILFNYFLRHRPKHILNPHAVAYSDNFYGLTPRDGSSSLAWFAALNSTASCVGLIGRARNQGAGLAKLQLFEYRDALVLDVRDWSEPDLKRLGELGTALSRDPQPMERTMHDIDRLVYQVTNDPRLEPANIAQELQKADRDAKKPGEKP